MKERLLSSKILNFMVASETILATKQEFFFTKRTPVQSIMEIALLGFSLILLPGMFISYYTISYFFVKNLFSNVYISVNTIFECSYLSFGWEIGHLLSTYVTSGMEVGHLKCLQIRTGVEGYHTSCVCMHFHYLFSCFVIFFMFLFYIDIYRHCFMVLLLLLLLLLNVLAVAVC